MTELEVKAERLKALGHPDRLRILRILSKECSNVGGLQERLNIAQATVSQHLNLLKRLRLVECQKKGTEACYRVSDDWLKKLMKII